MKLVINKRGVTLIELVIVIGILGIVLSAAYSFNLFGIKTYSMGQSQWNLQSNARMVSDLITREVRYVTEVELSEQTPALGDGYCYIRTEGNAVKYYKDGKLISAFPDITSEDIMYKVDFSGSEGNLLAFRVTAYDSRKEKSYSIDSKVLCLNIIDGESIINTQGIINSIRFK